MSTPQQVKIDELRRYAEAGDSDAQYALAAFLSGSGDRGEADRWLNAAADQGNGDALYTLTTRKLNSAGIEEAAQMLQRASAAGSVSAERLLGVLYADGLGVEKDWTAAVSHVLAAARRGYPPAMRELAMLLFAADPDDANGARLIGAAAMKDACAAVVVVRRAIAGRDNADAGLAAASLKRLEEARYPNLPALNAALHAAQPNKSFKPQTPDWDAIGARLADGPPAPSIEPETLCEEPSARIYRGAFTPEECEYVMAATVRFLAPSLIVDPQTGQSRPDAHRTSLTAVMAPVDLDLALVMINQRMAALAGRPAENGEFLSTLCYRPGDEYREHCDWLPPGPERDRNGQRVTTALLYLNQEYEGGETCFLHADKSFKGATGDVLVFENVLPGGEPDEASRHAGLAVTSGFKWLGSKWFRERKYKF